jgi:signal transduction histidine kinase
MSIFPTGIQKDVLQHYLSRTGNQHWLVRVASAFSIVVLVWGLEGLIAGLLASVWWVGASILEFWNFKRLRRQVIEVETANQGQLDKIMGEFFTAIAVLGVCYSLPALGLSFGSQNGKIFGIVVGATVLMNVAIQNVLHPRVILFSLPIPAITFLSVVMSLIGAQSQYFWVLVVGLVFILQTILLTLTVGRTDRALLHARKVAQEETFARGEADTANEAKTNFLATMSHELRTPLNAVIGYGELLRENAEFEERQTDVEDIDKVLASGRRLLQLVGEVLDMSQINAGALTLDQSAFDVGRELSKALDLATPLAKANQNTFTSSIAPDLGQVISDPARFRQCVENLLSNAAKFTKGGSIYLEAVRNFHPTGDIIVVSVSDNGIGISPDQLTRLFKPFTQVDESKTRAYEGAGLGLALTKSLAGLMGGDVSVTSALGKGSRFTLTIGAGVTSAAMAA